MPRATPYEAIQARLRPQLGDMVDKLPQKWELIGDVATIRLPDDVPDDIDDTLIGAAYADQLNARIVLADTGGITGELREPTVKRIHGDGSATTTHTENGIQYRTDPEHIMWSSGNIDERTRMAKIDATDETIVDLFAGIGYYTLPLLVHGNAERVHACEKNPESTRYLRENAELNNVNDRLTIHQGDCRVLAPAHIADRVILGYLPDCKTFIPTALQSLKPEGGTLLYHETVKTDHTERELLKNMLDGLQIFNPGSIKRNGPYFMLEDHTVHTVKSYAPGITHAVLDAEVRRV